MRENKQTILVDANVISHIAARPSGDYDTLTQRSQILSRKWWNSVEDFNVIISETVLQEISDGLREPVKRRLKVITGIEILRVTPEIISLADELVADGVLREKSHNDATILSTCCFYGVDYLVTWNIKDLANYKKKEDMIRIAQRHGYSSPIISTPEVFLTTYKNIHDPKTIIPDIQEEKVDYRNDLSYNMDTMKDIKDIKGTITAEDMENNPIYQEMRQIRKNILARYDNDWHKYMEALMAAPDVPGFKYIDPPPMSPGIKAYLQKRKDRLAAEELARKSSKANNSLEKRKERLAAEELANKSPKANNS